MKLPARAAERWRDERDSLVVMAAEEWERRRDRRAGLAAELSEEWVEAVRLATVPDEFSHLDAEMK